MESPQKNKYYLFNIGKPPTDAWWQRNIVQEVITAGFDNEPEDKGEKILKHTLAEGDWIIAYANRYGAVGVGRVAPSSTYRLLEPGKISTGREEPYHWHRRGVTWIYFVHSLVDAVPPRELGSKAYRSTTSRIKDQDDARRIIQLIADKAAIHGEVHPELELEGKFHYAEEIPSYWEGATEQIQVNRYERNSAARLACLDHWGSQCQVCGVDFQKTYGEIGRGVIHVHHLTPLASVGKAYQVNPVRDLRPVCPNCHSLLHRSPDPSDLKALQSILQIDQRVEK